jgi:hypothetical protein
MEFLACVTVGILVEPWKINRTAVIVSLIVDCSIGYDERAVSNTTAEPANASCIEDPPSGNVRKRTD